MPEPVTRRGFLAGLIAATPALAGASGIPPIPEEAAPTAATPGTSDRVAVTCTLNGQATSLDAGGDDVALRSIRQLGLTGAKEACGHGACGACAMHVDGVPVATCLMPTTALQGRDVRTIEGLGPNLHPVQRAFMAEDALQCGFCTPGFVMEAVAFHDGWRKTRGTEAPTRDEVAGALAGHLCRCGAYDAIYRAVIAACMGVHDAADPVFPRVDARDKVTGRAKYTVDVQEPGMLEGRILRSQHAAAKVVAIDVQPAMAIPGVKAVVAFVEAGRRVRFAGQELAAVAAIDRASADAGLAAIHVEWEVGRPVLSEPEALADDAPEVYEGKKGPVPLHFEGPSLPLHWRANLRGPLRTDILARPERAAELLHEARSTNRIVELEFLTQAQAHTALEPHACVASFEGDKLVVHLATQSVSDLAEDIASREKMKPADVTVRTEYVGGAFGAKASPQMELRAALELARQAKAPVRVVLDRHEELTVGGYRPGFRIKSWLGWDEEGALTAMGADSWGYGGVSIGATLGLMFRLIYPGSPRLLRDWDVITNGPPGAPFRGPGGPPAYFALEQMVDEAAIRMGTDPLTLRRKWDTSPVRLPLYDVVENSETWKRWGTKDEGRFRRGVGLAGAAWYYLHIPPSRVSLETTGDGRVLVSTASQDIGNGTRTTLRDVVVRELGIAADRVDVRVGDSQDVFGPSSSGSRTTASIVPATVDACRRLTEEIARTAEDHGSTPEQVRDTMKLRVVGRRFKDERSTPIPTSSDTKVGLGVPAALQMTEVEVDTRLGKVRVIGAWLGIAAGKMTSPVLARSQAQGAVVQGIGYALYEDRRLCPMTGRMLTAGMEDYRVPGIGDIPEIDVYFSETGFEHAAAGGTGMSELSTLPCAASIANAVRDATGWRPLELPIRPDRVLAGVRA